MPAQLHSNHFAHVHIQIHNPGDVIVVGMDYTAPNIALVEQGWVYALVGQPIYEECYKAVEILIAHLRGEPVQFDNSYPSPIITLANVDKYKGYSARVEAAVKEGMYAIP